MRILATSDLHGILPKVRLPTGQHDKWDLLLIAGDICPGRSVATQIQFLRKAFGPWLHSTFRRVKHIVFTGGNHDFIWADPRGLEEYRLLRAMFPGLHLLLDTGITLREDGHSLSLWGSPWTLVCDCPGWAFQASDEAAIKENYMCRGSIPQVDIFLAHSPIYGVLDRAQGIRHIGSKSLGRIIADTEPQLLVHGHVHEDFGMAQFGNTIVGNVSYLGDNMVPRKEMVELHYEKENAQLSVVGLHSVS